MMKHYPGVGVAAILAALPLAATALATPIDGGVPQRYNGVDPNAEYRAGMAALGNDKFRDARMHFQRLLTVERDHPVALFRLGEADAGLGDLKSAASDFEASLRQDPHQVRAASELAVIDAQLGRRAKADAIYKDIQTRAAACNDACPEAQDLKQALNNIGSAMPETSAAAPPPAKAPTN